MTSNNKNKTLLYLAVSAVVLSICITIGMIIWHGGLFSSIQYDEKNNCYVYQNNKYYPVKSQNYYTYKRKNKIGRVWGESFYTIENDDSETVIVVTGSRDVKFLIKENVDFGVDNHITGAYLTKGLDNQYTNNKEILRKLENLENHCIKTSNNLEIADQVKIGFCYHEIPVSIKSADYVIGYCNESTWVLVTNQTEQEMLQITDADILEILNEFLFVKM